MTLTESRPTTTRTLRTLLTVNGASNAVGGLVLLPLAGVLGAAMGLERGVIAGAAVFYVGYGALMWWVATHPRPRAVLGVIAVNPLWAATCLVLLAADHPTPLGTVLLAAEAVTVTVLAALELRAYRRSAP